MSDAHSTGNGATPFLELDRGDWAALAPRTSQPFRPDELAQIAGIGERLDVAEVAEVYAPLSGLLNLYATSSRSLRTEYFACSWARCSITSLSRCLSCAA